MPRIRSKFPFSWPALVVLGLLALAPAAAEAARPTGPSQEPGQEDLLVGDPLVRRIQEGLAAEGLYTGPVDGRVGPDTEQAIRAYQKRNGIRIDGGASEELAVHIETAGRMQRLLKRLERVRMENIAAAREALLANPATRHLLTEAPDNGDVADPTRDPTPCLSRPTPECLLGEATESAKAVQRGELRNWVLGEILVAQAKAGLADAATLTLRRMSDPRLVVVALRNIAEAQAEAGRADEALEAAALIPDAEKKAEALIAIADRQAHAGRDPVPAAKGAIDLIGQLAQPPRRVALLTDLAVVLVRAGDTIAAKGLLEEAGTLARSLDSGRGGALRNVAAALAEGGHPDAALAVLSEVPDESDRTSVLIAAATAQAKAGRPDEALETARTIDADRYRPGVLARIALAQMAAGDPAAGQATLRKAIDDCQAIDFPFARAFAVSRVVMAMVEAAETSGDGSMAGTALEAAARIGDARLRAEALWTLSGVLRRQGNPMATEARDKAETATAEIKSQLSAVWMFADLARLWGLAGDRDAGREAFRRGTGVAGAITNAWSRSRAMAKLASVLVDLGNGRFLK